MHEDSATLVGPGWEVTDRLAVRGRAFDRAGGSIDLLEAYRGASTLESMIETTRRLVGFFGVIRETEEAFYLACDIARSVPLYFTESTPVSVADTVHGPEVVPTGSGFDPVAESEFALTRYVTRGETLLPSVKSVRAGEVVRVPKDAPSSSDRRRYDRYRPSTGVDGDEAAYLAEMGDVLAAVFDRAASVIGDRPVVVPLSGGVDSRLVATMFAERGCEVHAFTFGRRGHADVEVSRDVADALGIDWAWVEYTPTRWHEWYHSDARRAYHDYAFDYDGLPFLAEWPAVRELLADGRLPRDAVVCPGHTVATPSERVPDEWVDAPPSEAAVVEYILDSHYDLWEWDDPGARAVFKRRIAADAGLDAGDRGAAGAAAYERWEWTTRMTTFTTGDLRLYDWFDLDWWLPLWDPEFVRFWASVPLGLRHGKSLERTFTSRKYARVAGIDAASASRTDREWTPFDQIRRTFREHPLSALGGGFESWLGAQANPRSRWERWGNYPLGWYGVIRERHADRFADAKSLYALRTLAAVGRISFDPPRIVDPPLRRNLELPPSGGTLDP